MSSVLLGIHSTVLARQRSIAVACPRAVAQHRRRLLPALAGRIGALVGSARWPVRIGALSLQACAVAVFAPTARPG